MTFKRIRVPGEEAIDVAEVLKSRPAPELARGAEALGWIHAWERPGQAPRSYGCSAAR